MEAVFTEEFLKVRAQGKTLFKQGKIQDSFEYIQKELLDASRKKL